MRITRGYNTGGWSVLGNITTMVNLINSKTDYGDSDAPDLKRFGTSDGRSRGGRCVFAARQPRGSILSARDQRPLTVSGRFVLIRGNNSAFGDW